MGSLFLLQGIFPESNPFLLYLALRADSLPLSHLRSPRKALGVGSCQDFDWSRLESAEGRTDVFLILSLSNQIRSTPFEAVFDFLWTVFGSFSGQQSGTSFIGFFFWLLDGFNATEQGHGEQGQFSLEGFLCPFPLCPPVVG